MQIVIGTNNRNKADEIISILKSKFSNLFDILSLSDFQQKIEIEETGETFAENAELKSKQIFSVLKIPVISDDSGLEVDILNGAPGVISARYAGKNASDQENRKKLIQELSNFSGDSFSAKFQCVICYYDGSNLIKGTGFCSGRIILTERGTNGFGYDPLFIPDGYDKTFAEMPAEIKNKISHRSNAFSDFLNNFQFFINQKFEREKKY